MRKIYVSLLFIINVSILLCQSSFKTQITELDNVIKNKEFEKAEIFIDDLEKTYGNEGLFMLKLLDRKVWIAKARLNDSLKIFYMEEYIFSKKSTYIYEQEKQKGLSIFRSSLSKDTFRVLINLSQYSFKLSETCFKLGRYTEALNYLNIHESKYPAPYDCGSGYAYDLTKRVILRSMIDQNLGSQDSVIQRLLPYNFEESWQFFTPKSLYHDIDSILYQSIFELYTKEEVLKELNRCIKELIKIGPQVNGFMEYNTYFKFFDNEITNTTIMMRRRIKERRLEVYKVRDEIKRKEILTELYNESVREAIQNMRLFKLVEK